MLDNPQPRVQITGPDERGYVDLFGIVGFVIKRSKTGNYLVYYYDAPNRRYAERWLPADSVEEIS